jgi:exonuclease SbcD
MKFVHAADIHLDSPLHGLSAYPDAPAAQLRNATREAFSALVTRAIDEAVDFVVIAGDLYDGDWRDHNTGLFFCAEMGRLRRAGIRVFLLYGNHDAESEMTRRLDLPDNVHAFSSRKAETIRLDDLRVALHGHSFRTRDTTENLAADYPPPVPGWFNIGVLHTALAGHAAHQPYAPCTLEELQARGYEYWALGHVHEHQVWRAASTVVFPGNLQGRHVRETGRRGAVLVTVDDGGVPRVERLLVDVLRWEVLTVDAAPHARLVDVSRAIGRALEDLVATDAHVPRAVRVTIDGRTAAHGELFGREAQLRHEVLAQVAQIGHHRVWLEKVRLQTCPPEDAAVTAARLDAFADLRAILDEAGQDPAFLQSLADDLAGFAARLPVELHDRVPTLPMVRAQRVDQLVREVSPALVAHLANAAQS